MRRVARHFAAFLVLGFFFAPGFAWVAGADVEILENRDLRQFPGFSFARLTHPRFYQELELYLADQLRLRLHAVRLDTWVRAELLKQRNIRGTWRGAEDILFLATELNMPCHGANSAGHALESFAGLQQEVVASGRQFRAMLAPDKVSIYPELAGLEEFPRVDCWRNNQQILRDGIQNLAARGFVDLWRAMEAAKEKEPSRLLYFRKDEHWNERGALVATASLLDSLRPDLWQNSDQVAVNPHRRYPLSLARLRGWNETEDWPEMATRRPGVASVEMPANAAPHGGVAQTFHTIAHGAEVIPGRTLLIFDSFMEPNRRILAPYFEALTSVHWSQLHRPEVDRLFTDAHTIILSSSERFSYERARLIASPGMQARLRAALAEPPAAMSVFNPAKIAYRHWRIRATAGNGAAMPWRVHEMEMRIGEAAEFTRPAGITAISSPARPDQEAMLAFDGSRQSSWASLPAGDGLVSEGAWIGWIFETPATITGLRLWADDCPFNVRIEVSQDGDDWRYLTHLDGTLHGALCGAPGQGRVSSGEMRW